MTHNFGLIDRNRAEKKDEELDFYLCSKSVSSFCRWCCSITTSVHAKAAGDFKENKGG